MVLGCLKTMSSRVLFIGVSRHTSMSRRLGMLRKSLTSSLFKLFHISISSLSYSLSGGLYDVTIKRVMLQEVREKCRPKCQLWLMDLIKLRLWVDQWLC